MLDHLSHHRFQPLFIDALGWDRAGGSYTVTVDDRTYTLCAIAHKRGLQVIHCATERQTLCNRRRLRAIQRQVTKFAHEHILIYSSQEPRKQVWQWAIRQPDGRRFLHREHPFFSNQPPVPFLARLDGLKFQLDEEDRIGLLDALARARMVLDAKPDLNLFASKPWYAEQSNRLFAAMRSGGTAEFQAFVMFHRPLANWAAKRYHQRYHQEEEDAQQICMLALIDAARLFDPSRGFQFSTYAITAMRRHLERVREQAFLIRLPVHIWPKCFYLGRELNGLLVNHGPSAVRDRMSWLAENDAGLLQQWLAYQQTHEVCPLDECRESQLRQVDRRRDLYQSPIERLTGGDWSLRIREAVKCLQKNDAIAVELKFGLDGTERTLEEVGKIMHVTRERIRQRLKRAIGRLRRFLRKEVEEFFEVKLPEESVFVEYKRPDAEHQARS